MISQTRAERYARAKGIFLAALEIDAAQHEEFLRTNCGDDFKLRCEVETLLAARDKVRDFLSAPAVEADFNYENLTNKIIGGYRLQREISAGGMGVVFLAEKSNGEFNRQVALKLVKNNLRSATFFKRFILEREILNRLAHPNVARLIDGGATDDGAPYFVMEYIRGVTLIEYAEAKELSLAARLELFQQVCAAVSFAHQHAVIHRDLKPSNILVTDDGTVKLLDFGVAKLLSPDTVLPVETATTFRAMTPEYAAPEQIRGETATTVSDVYSLGVLLYRLLTGTSPYSVDSDNLNEIIRAVCESEPVRPSSAFSNSKIQISDFKDQKTNPNSKFLKGDLDNIILKTMQKEPSRRYSSVEALSEDLRRHLAGLPVSARRDTFAYRAEKFVRRNRLTVALSTLVILALIGGISATVWQARRAERERERAERRFNEVRALANSFVFEFNDEILKGQTQGRELVVKRALEYLDNLTAEAGDEASLQMELAVAYLKIGDIQGKPYSPNLGETEGAFESYGKALRILETLHQIDSANREIQSDLATAYLNIGSLQILRAFKKDDALTNIQKAQTLCEVLLAAEPHNVEYRRMLADVYKSFGDALKDRPERIAMYCRALDLREETLKSESSNAADRTAVASIHQRIGTQFEHNGNVAKNVNNYQNAANNYRAALENFDDALEIYRNQSAIEPDNSRYRRNIADMTAMKISALANLGEKSNALKSYEASLKIFEELSAADPKNAEAQLDIAYTYQIMCRTQVRVFKDFRGATATCGEGLKISRALSAKDPKNAEVRVYIYDTDRFIAEAQKKIGNNSLAIKTYGEALKVLENWLSVEPKNDSAARYATDIRREISELNMIKNTQKKIFAGEKAKNR